MLGFSIYLSEGPINEKERYIKQMVELGFKTIFTSLHIPEDNFENYKQYLYQLGKMAIKYNMDLVADISPKSLNDLDYTWEDIDQLKKIGVTGLRVDYGISEEIIGKLSEKIKIAINASTITEEVFHRLKKNGLQTSSTESWHNYYPRPETGLDLEDFNEKNRWLKSEGLTVMAFIPGDGKKRGPVFSGLPTLERHRNMSTFSAFLELKNNKWVDKILIGDISVSSVTLEQFAAYQKGYMLLRAVPFIKDENILERMCKIQTNRLDSARDVIRSTESRQYGLIGDQFVNPFNTIERSVGAITMDNTRYGRYRGEVQICKRSLPADHRVNVIGEVIKDDLPLLPFINGGMKFKISWVN